jgi:uncharacterized protein
MVAFLATGPDDGTDRPVAAARPKTRSSPETVRVVTGDGIEVCARCEVAERTIPRMRGLLGRNGLALGEGMLINPAPSVMTFFMRFPIDVVFIDKAKTIVKIVHSLGPWKTAGARGSSAALELPAGTAAALELKPGMTLVLANDGAAQ